MHVVCGNPRRRTTDRMRRPLSARPVSLRCHRNRIAILYAIRRDGGTGLFLINREEASLSMHTKPTPPLAPDDRTASASP